MFEPDGPGAIGEPPIVLWPVLPEAPGAVGDVVVELPAAAPPEDPAEPDDPDDPVCAKANAVLPARSIAANAPKRTCFAGITNSLYLFAPSRLTCLAARSSGANRVWEFVLKNEELTPLCLLVRARRLVIAVTMAVKEKRHQSTPDDKGEDDTQGHRDVARRRHRRALD
jgi:hypothetical protein